MSNGPAKYPKNKFGLFDVPGIPEFSGRNGLKSAQAVGFKLHPRGKIKDTPGIEAGEFRLKDALGKSSEATPPASDPDLLIRVAQILATVNGLSPEDVTKALEASARLKSNGW